MEQQTQQRRREKLRAWLHARGGTHDACVAAGLKKTTESQISQILTGYTIGSRAARGIEQKFGMEEGYLDTVEDASEVAPVPKLSAQAIELGLLFDMITDRVARAAAYSAASKPLLEMLQEIEARSTRARDLGL